MNNLKKPVRYAIYCLAAVSGLVILSALDTLVNWDELKAEESSVLTTKPLAKDSYNGYGLTNGETLSNQLIQDENGMALYSDRIFPHFVNQTNYTTNAALLADTVQSKIGARSLSVVPIPERVLCEDIGDDDRMQYEQCMQTFKTSISSEAELINCLPQLEQHSDEYIFFRTENSWTARGAYYASAMVNQKIGNQVLNLSDYDERLYQSFEGSTASVWKQQYQDTDAMMTVMNNIPKDHCYYYLTRHAKNLETYYTEDETGAVQSYKRPMISSETSGISAFVEGDFTYAVVEGEGSQGTLLMITDTSGNLMVPYFTEYYQNIYVVNVEENYMSAEDLQNVLNTYDISDVVWSQRITNMGNPAYSRALDAIAK